MTTTIRERIAAVKGFIARAFPRIRDRSGKQPRELAFEFVVRHQDVAEDLEELKDEHDAYIADPNQVRQTRYRKGWRKRMSVALGNEGLAQFGPRTRDAANLLVTRKFLRDRLKEAQHKDLRKADASVIIEEALDYSFLPPQHAIDRAAMMSTPEYRYRMGVASRRPRGFMAWLRALMPFSPMYDEDRLHMSGAMRRLEVGGFGGHMSTESVS